MTKEYKRIWECPECSFTAEMSYDDITDVGNPICTDCDIKMELTEEVKEKVQIAVYIRGGVCDDVQVNLPDEEWIWALVDYDDNPDLPDDHDPFKE